MKLKLENDVNSKGSPFRGRQVDKLHQSLSGEILPHFDINNLSVALKLKKLEKGPFHPKL